MNEWMNEWMNACMHAWMNEWMNEWMNARTHARTHARTKEGRKEGRKEWMNEWRYLPYSCLYLNCQIGTSCLIQTSRLRTPSHFPFHHFCGVLVFLTVGTWSWDGKNWLPNKFYPDCSPRNKTITVTADNRLSVTNVDRSKRKKTNTPQKWWNGKWLGVRRREVWIRHDVPM
jgi:hypothetical protein